MTKKKIRDLTTLSAADDLDLLAIVDIDEPILENQTKKITVSTLLNGLGGGINSLLTTAGDIYTHDGLGDIRLGVGQDGQVLTANSLAPDGSGLSWQNIAGAQEDYLNVNSTGTPPITNSTESIAIGASAAVGSNSAAGVAIGFSAQVGNNDANSIAIGNNPSAFSPDTIAIGHNTNVSGGADSIAIGARNITNGPSHYVLGTDNVIDGGTSAVYAFASSNQSFGEQNVIQDSRQVFVVGQQNTVTGIGDAVVFGEDNVMTGAFSGTVDSNMFNNIQIGHQNVLTDSTEGPQLGGRIQLGTQNTHNGVGSYQSVQIGFSTTIGSNSEFGIAIGTDAAVGDNAPGAVQIGIGTNSETNTLRFRQAKIAGTFGIVAPLEAGTPTSIVDDGYIRIDNTNDALYFRSSGNWVQAGGGGDGEPYVEINSTATLPTSTGTDSISIGPLSDVSSNRGIGIGYNTTVNDNSGIAIGDQATALSPGGVATNGIAMGTQSFSRSSNGIAIGFQAAVESTSGIAIGTLSEVTANNCIQLGPGSNSTSSTLQYQSNTIANAEGIQAPITTGNNLGSPPSGSIYVDDTNGSERICVYLNGGWKCANLTT